MCAFAGLEFNVNQCKAKVLEYLKCGIFCILGRPKVRHETHMLKYGMSGMSRKIRDGWHQRHQNYILPEYSVQ